MRADLFNLNTSLAIVDATTDYTLSSEETKRDPVQGIL